MNTRSNTSRHSSDDRGDTNTPASKKQLRTELRKRLAALDTQAIHDRSNQAANHLAELPVFRKAEAIMLYLPLPGEVDVTTIALRAWQQDKTVTVPLVSYEQKHMIPVRLLSLDEPMDIDHYGVRAPKTGHPFPVEMVDLVIVPGLGFDKSGHRLGRGSGFYDRFLSQSSFKGTTIGIAFEEQLVPSVPAQSHDVIMSQLVTDTRVLRCSRYRQHRQP